MSERGRERESERMKRGREMDGGNSPLQQHASSLYQVQGVHTDPLLKVCLGSTRSWINWLHDDAQKSPRYTVMLAYPKQLESISIEA